MKRHDLVTISIWATATMGVVLAMGLPETLHGVGDMKRVEISLPKLQYQGCELTVRLISPQAKATNQGLPICEAGQPAVLEMTVTNTSSGAVNVPWSLSMQGTMPSSPLMRVMPRPRQMWTESGSTMVAPGESKIVKFDTKIAMSPGYTMSVIGQDVGKAGDQNIAGINLLSWAVQPAQERKIAAR